MKPSKSKLRALERMNHPPVAAVPVTVLWPSASIKKPLRYPHPAVMRPAKAV
jgi:hypothetical protein